VADLAWLRATGLAAALDTSETPVVAICAGLQMCGTEILDPAGVEGPAGTTPGLGWLPVASRFEAPKVLDRRTARVVAGPGAGESAAGYRIHHGRTTGDPDAQAWLVATDGTTIGWHSERVLATNLHGLFEDDGLRRAILGWAADRAGLTVPPAGQVSFAGERAARLDRMADALEAHLDLDRLFAIIEQGALDPAGAAR
jgi:adenosylcobyric acid synthase